MDNNPEEVDFDTAASMAMSGDNHMMALISEAFGDQGLHAEAKVFFTKVLSAGHGSANFYLGLNELEREDPKQAIEYLAAAYKSGFVDACFVIGDVYDFLGNESKAREWYIRGAEHGDPECMNALGMHFHIKGDFPGAYAWMTKAAACDHSSAIKSLQQMNMTVEYARKQGKDLLTPK